MLQYDYVSILLIILNVFVFLLFIFLVFVLYKEYRFGIEKEEEVVKQHAYTKAMYMLDEARNKAMEILKESAEKSQDIVRNAEFLTGNSKELLENELRKLTSAQTMKISDINQQILQDYHKALQNETEESINTIRSMTRELEKEAVQDVDKFAHELEEKTLHSEEILKQQIEHEFEEARHKVKEYEKEKIDHINKNIDNILHVAIKDIFKKSIEVKTNEELVMEALDRAMKEGVMS